MGGTHAIKTPHLAELKESHSSPMTSIARVSIVKRMNCHTFVKRREERTNHFSVRAFKRVASIGCMTKFAKSTSIWQTFAPKQLSRATRRP